MYVCMCECVCLCGCVCVCGRARVQACTLDVIRIMLVKLCAYIVCKCCRKHGGSNYYTNICRQDVTVHTPWHPQITCNLRVLLVHVIPKLNRCCSIPCDSLSRYQNHASSYPSFGHLCPCSAQSWTQDHTNT